MVASVQLSSNVATAISARMRPLPVRPEESLADRRRRVIRARADDRRRMTVGGLRWADLPPDVLRLVVKFAAGHHLATCDAPDPDACDACRRALDDPDPDPAFRRGAVPVVPVVASVCRAWRDAMRVHPAELWRVADFSGDFDPPAAALSRLCAAGAFSRLVHLDLTDCPNASSDASLAAILAAAPALRHVAVSDVGATKRAARFATVVAAAGRLASVRVDGLVAKSDAEVAAALPKMVHDESARVALTRFEKMPRDALSVIASRAGARLSTLDLSRSRCSRGGASIFPWVELARSCPGLRTLNLAGFGGTDGWTPRPKVGAAGDPWNPVMAALAAARDDGGEISVVAKNAGAPSWPHLLDLNLSVADRVPSAKGGSRAGRNELCTALLHRLTWNSSRLRALDVSGCEGARVDAGAWSPGVEPSFGSCAPCVFSRVFEPLEVLRAGDTEWASDCGLETILRFGGTTPRFPNLRELDLASAAAPNLRRATRLAGVAGGHPKLRVLDLSGSAVTDEEVATFLAAHARESAGTKNQSEGVPPGSNLRRLGLERCRGTSRATRRAAAERTPRDAYAAAVEAVREERGDATWTPEVWKRSATDVEDAVIVLDD